MLTRVYPLERGLVWLKAGHGLVKEAGRRGIRPYCSVSLGAMRREVMGLVLRPGVKA